MLDYCVFDDCPMIGGYNAGQACVRELLPFPSEHEIEQTILMEGYIDIERLEK